MKKKIKDSFVMDVTLLTDLFLRWILFCLPPICIGEKTHPHYHDYVWFSLSMLIFSPAVQQCTFWDKMPGNKRACSF